MLFSTFHRNICSFFPNQTKFYIKWWSVKSGQAGWLLMEKFASNRKFVKNLDFFCRKYFWLAKYCHWIWWIESGLEMFASMCFLGRQIKWNGNTGNKVLNVCRIFATELQWVCNDFFYFWGQYRFLSLKFYLKLILFGWIEKRTKRLLIDKELSALSELTNDLFLWHVTL